MIVAVALVSNSWVMASQELIDRLEAIHHEVDCSQFAVDTGSINDSMKDLSNRYSSFWRVGPLGVSLKIRTRWLVGPVDTFKMVSEVG